MFNNMRNNKDFKRTQRIFQKRKIKKKIYL